MKPAQYAKAIVGAIVAALTALATGLTDGHLTAVECLAAAIAFFVALGGVWKIPNAGA